MRIWFITPVRGILGLYVSGGTVVEFDGETDLATVVTSGIVIWVYLHGLYTDAETKTRVDRDRLLRFVCYGPPKYRHGRKV
jgi:hypothetical protein